jgi:hypothetical protein
MQVVGSHVRSDNVHIIIKSAATALDFKQVVAGSGMRIRGAINNFCPV